MDRVRQRVHIEDYKADKTQSEGRLVCVGGAAIRLPAEGAGMGDLKGCSGGGVKAGGRVCGGVVTALAAPTPLSPPPYPSPPPSSSAHRHLGPRHFPSFPYNIPTQLSKLTRTLNFIVMERKRYPAITVGILM
ncbi:hypothetical protein E2C01_036087 [Portunus trituberculatus]|uniref:Uncharacterized protein n=1 Tax=Portunus trituberculatus TaxID=210409 RepID=A0A5B7FA57_PORTR|nr:hypothetical protein [Portunus trituberculatus]